METGTHAANSILVGDVESRTHAGTESQDHFESASRVLSYPNKCHALMFYFFRINKSQTVRWMLASIERCMIDPIAPKGIRLVTPVPDGGVSAALVGILASAKDRFEVEQRSRASILAAAGATDVPYAASANLTTAPGFAVAANQVVLTEDVRLAALAAVDKGWLQQDCLIRKSVNYLKRRRSCTVGTARSYCQPPVSQ